MARQPFEDRRTTTACGNPRLSDTREAAGEPEGTGNRGEDREPDRADWDRFFAYCDRVIVTALAGQPIQPADREDCRQEIWADLLATQMSGFHGGNLAAWLKTLARHKAIDTMRRARRQSWVGDEAMERAVAPTGLRPADERVSIVRLALAVLERRVSRGATPSSS